MRAGTQIFGWQRAPRAPDGETFQGATAILPNFPVSPPLELVTVAPTLGRIAGWLEASLASRMRAPCDAAEQKLVRHSFRTIAIDGGFVGTEYGHYLGRRCGWAVVNTQPHREQIAVENLQRQEFVPYCPLVRRRHRHARRVADVLRPLFPGYLFVRIKPDLERWRPMLSTVGVRSVVRCGEKVSLLDDAFVHAIRAREVDGVISRPECPYRIGQQVRVSGGAFDGLVATIVEMHERDRLTVLMQILSRTVKVRLDESQVSSA